MLLTFLGRKFRENCQFCFKDATCKRQSLMNQFCHVSQKEFKSSHQTLIEVYSQICERKYFSRDKRQIETLKPLILFSGTNQCT